MNGQRGSGGTSSAPLGLCVSIGAFVAESEFDQLVATLRELIDRRCVDPCRGKLTTIGSGTAATLLKLCRCCGCTLVACGTWLLTEFDGERTDARPTNRET